MAEVISDGFDGLSGGMNSALSPHLIADSQYHVGFNITSRSGQVNTRPAFRFVENAFNPTTDGDYRGSLLYKHRQGGTTLLAVVGNKVKVAPVSSSVASVSLANVSGVTLPSSAGTVYLCALQSYVVIQDGQNTPVVLKAPLLAGGTWTTTTYGDTVPIGTHMAYGHGRLFVVCPAGATRPVLKVNMTPVQLKCTVTFGGKGYLKGGTNDNITSATGALAVYPKYSTDGFVTSTVPTSFTVSVRSGVVTGVTITQPLFSTVPEVRLFANNSSGNLDDTGASGAGAIIATELSPTTVQSVTVVSGGAGSGITLKPTLTFDNAGSGGNGATAEVTVSGGVVTSVSMLTTGSGYNRPPKLVLSNLGGPSEEIFASDIIYGGSSEFLDIESSRKTSDGTVITLNTTVPFTDGETVSIEGHSSFPSIDGVWAAKSVGTVPVSSKKIKSILIDDAGSGYTTAPQILIDDPPSGGRRAVASAVIGGSIDSVTVVSRGSGYTNTSGNPPGANIKVDLSDSWPPGGSYSAPIFQLVLGRGQAVDQVPEDQVKEVIVLSGGAGFESNKQGQAGSFNSANGEWTYSSTSSVLPMPPRVRVFDKNASNQSSGVEATNVNGVFSYPAGKAHATLTANTTTSLVGVNLIDSGDGYVTAPAVEVVGSSTTPALLRAVLDDVTERNTRAFTIPASIVASGVGGRVRRSRGGSFEDVFRFTESTFLSEGGGYSVAGTAGRVRGLFFLPVANSTSGRGDLFVLGDKGAVTMNVSISRLAWKSSPFIRTALMETGAIADGAFCVAQGDVFFYSGEGLRNLRNAQTGEVDGSVMPLDTELSGILSQASSPTLSSRVAYYDNRLFFTVANQAPTGWKALAVLDWASSFTGREQMKPAWDGFWFAPGENPNGTLNQSFLDIVASDDMFFAFCTNGLFILDKTRAGDVLTLDTSVGQPINWTLETRALSFNSSSSTKRLTRASIWVQDARGPNTFGLSWRTENRPNWTPWVSNYQYNSTANGYAYRMDLSVPGGSSTSNTDAEMRVGEDRGQRFQFRLEGSGRLKFSQFVFYALPVVESQYGVVQSATVIIVPTGTSETYPL